MPGAGEVVVAIDAALTCATDAKMLARGRHPALGPLPAAFGHEGTGSVAAIGRGVRGVGEGDAVAFANSAPCGTCEWCLAGREGLCAHITYLTGTYAEYLRVPAAIVRTNVVGRPTGLAAPLAALAEPVACGVRAAERSAAREGQSVVILGGGLQGQVIGAVLAQRGCLVTVCDPHPERRDLALLMGATAVADAPRDDEGIARVRALTPVRSGRMSPSPRSGRSARGRPRSRSRGPAERPTSTAAPPRMPRSACRPRGCTTRSSRSRRPITTPRRPSGGRWR